jgi:hypothetical protein
VREKEGAKCTICPLYKGFETDPSYLTLITYKSIVVFVRSLKLALVTRDVTLRVMLTTLQCNYNVI